MPAPSGETSNLRADIEKSASTNQEVLISVIRNALVTLQNSENPEEKALADRARVMLDNGDVYNSSALIINYLREGTTGGSRRKTRKTRKGRRSTRKSRR